jgi:ATP-dependent Clp protease ATP-binding subunit ClpA
MYERFTDRARKVMQLANQEAQRFNHGHIGTEHLLIGLTKEGTGVAANVLKNLDVDLRKLRLEVEKIVRPVVLADQMILGKLPHTPQTKQVIENALDTARGLGHNHVGTEHLLLGILQLVECVAAQVLANLGVKPDDARTEVVALLANNRGDTPPPPAQEAVARRVAPPLAVQPTAYYLREECGGMAYQIGFATHAELMAYMASIGRLAEADSPVTVEGGSRG